jgi:UDP-N-acetylglucosamine diphosphorylase/glucosamine-1-phosphate N-acetyltransferase
LTYCSAQTIDDCVETWKATLAPRQVGGQIVKHLWDLVDRNGDQIALDCRRQFFGSARTATPIAVVGPEQGLRIDPTAHLDPMVVADTRDGPVVVDAGAVVHAFSRLEGPCYIGPRTQVLGAKVRAGTTLGPNCRIGGEVEASIIQGYSNKYHEGFLGHSYVGEWVNLGAGTHNSDLRNDYGKVAVTVDGRVISTGLHKVGCFIGDHTKAGLGTLLNTGTSIGVGCNLLPSGCLLPKYVPSFCSWWNGAIVDRSSLSQFEEVAVQVMRRRGAAFTDDHATVIRFVHELSAPERERVPREAAMRMLRKSA